MSINKVEHAEGVRQAQQNVNTANNALDKLNDIMKRVDDMTTKYNANAPVSHTSGSEKASGRQNSRASTTNTGTSNASQTDTPSTSRATSSDTAHDGQRASTTESSNRTQKATSSETSTASRATSQDSTAPKAASTSPASNRTSEKSSSSISNVASSSSKTTSSSSESSIAHGKTIQVDEQKGRTNQGGLTKVRTTLNPLGQLGEETVAKVVEDTDAKSGVDDIKEISHLSGAEAIIKSSLAIGESEATRFDAKGEAKKFDKKIADRENLKEIDTKELSKEIDRLTKLKTDDLANGTNNFSKEDRKALRIATQDLKKAKINNTDKTSAAELRSLGMGTNASAKGSTAKQYKAQVKSISNKLNSEYNIDYASLSQTQISKALSSGKLKLKGRTVNLHEDARAKALLESAFSLKKQAAGFKDSKHGVKSAKAAIISLGTEAFKDTDAAQGARVVKGGTKAAIVSAKAGMGLGSAAVYTTLTVAGTPLNVAKGGAKLAAKITKKFAPASKASQIATKAASGLTKASDVFKKGKELATHPLRSAGKGVKLYAQKAAPKLVSKLEKTWVGKSAKTVSAAFGKMAKKISAVRTRILASKFFKSKPMKAVGYAGKGLDFAFKGVRTGVGGIASGTGHITRGFKYALIGAAAGLVIVVLICGAVAGSQLNSSSGSANTNSDTRINVSTGASTVEVSAANIVSVNTARYNEVLHSTLWNWEADNDYQAQIYSEDYKINRILFEPGVSSRTALINSYTIKTSLMDPITENKNIGYNLTHYYGELEDAYDYTCPVLCYCVFGLGGIDELYDPSRCPITPGGPEVNTCHWDDIGPYSEVTIIEVVGEDTYEYTIYVLGDGMGEYTLADDISGMYYLSPNGDAYQEKPHTETYTFGIHGIANMGAYYGESSPDAYKTYDGFENPDLLPSLGVYDIDADFRQTLWTDMHLDLTKNPAYKEMIDIEEKYVNADQIGVSYKYEGREFSNPLKVAYEVGSTNTTPDLTSYAGDSEYYYNDGVGKTIEYGREKLYLTLASLPNMVKSSGQCDPELNNFYTQVMLKHLNAQSENHLYGDLRLYVGEGQDWETLTAQNDTGIEGASKLRKSVHGVKARRKIVKYNNIKWRFNETINQIFYQDGGIWLANRKGEIVWRTCKEYYNIDCTVLNTIYSGTGFADLICYDNATGLTESLATGNYASAGWFDELEDSVGSSTTLVHALNTAREEFPFHGWFYEADGQWEMHNVTQNALYYYTQGTYNLESYFDDYETYAYYSARWLLPGELPKEGERVLGYAETFVDEVMANTPNASGSLRSLLLKAAGCVGRIGFTPDKSYLEPGIDKLSSNGWITYMLRDYLAGKGYTLDGYDMITEATAANYFKENTEFTGTNYEVLKPGSILFRDSESVIGSNTTDAAAIFFGFQADGSPCIISCTTNTLSNYALGDEEPSEYTYGLTIQGVQHYNRNFILNNLLYPNKQEEYYRIVTITEGDALWRNSRRAGWDRAYSIFD